MKRLLTLVFLWVPLLLMAGRPNQHDLVRFVDPNTGRDTVISVPHLVVQHLYTDSLRIGIPEAEGTRVERWLDLDCIDYFRFDNELYDDHEVVRLDGTHQRIFLLMERRGRGRANIYKYGRGLHSSYYYMGQDSLLHQIDNLRDYKMEERVRRTGNTNYYRPRFSWGVLAGVAGNRMTPTGMAGGGDYSPLDYGRAIDQTLVTAGLWADVPLDPLGFSLHAKAYLLAASAEQQVPGNRAMAFNARSISVPVTMRYTALSIPFPVVPYVEVGFDLRYVTSSSLDLLVRESAIVDNHRVLKYKAPDRLLTPLLLGGGLEYKLSRQHSLWLEVSFTPEFDFFGREAEMDVMSGMRMQNWMATVSYNL